jgi:hypothetical protein
MVLTRIARGARRTGFVVRIHLQHLRAASFIRPIRLNSHRARPAIAAAISMYAAFAPLGSSAFATPLPSATSIEDSLRPRLVVAQTVPRATIQSSGLTAIRIGESRSAAEQARLAQIEAEEAARAAALKAEEEQRQIAAAEAERARIAAEVAAQRAAALAQQAALAAVTAPVSAVSLDKQELIDLIVKWSEFYGADSARMIRLAQCESGIRATAKNPRSDASGLFQFMPATFRANATRLGIQNQDIWNPDQQAQTAAWMIGRINQAYQWECKY